MYEGGLSFQFYNNLNANAPPYDVPEPQCTNAGHALLLVGYYAPNGPGAPDSYWIAKNSFGDT